MRLSIYFAAISAAVLAGMATTRAQPIPPWCLRSVMAEDWAVDLCYYRTFESCNQERFNHGPKSYCIVNSHYYFRYGEPDQPRRATRVPQR